MKTSTPTPMNIVIYGATGRIGSKIAAHYALFGHKLTLSGRNPSKLGRLKADLEGAHAQFILAEGTDPEAVQHVLDSALKFGRIDLVISSVGSHGIVSLKTPIGEALAQLREHMQQFAEVTLVTAMAAVQIFKEQEHGLYVSISSHVTSDDTLDGNITYRAGKVASESILKDMRNELKGTKVLVKSIAPSTVNTPDNEKYFKSEEDRANAVQPEEIADKILEIFNSDDSPDTIVMVKEGGRFKAT